MNSLVIPIEGTFDIAKGRSAIRSSITAHRWPVQMNARASALFTALGDLIVLNQQNELVLVQVEIEDETMTCGIQLSCTVAAQPRHQFADQLINIESRIRQAADRVDIADDGQSIHIIAYLFV